MSCVKDSAMDARTLRNAFGRFATGVAVVTTTDEAGRPVGVTVNSFTSVSLDPPLVLFCILNHANNHAVWRNAERFTVNLLTEEQRALSNAFARPNQAPWQEVAYSAGGNGCPVLDGASASIECVRHADCPGGDHLVIFGEVLQIHTHSENAPLIFYRGQYAQLHERSASQ